MKLRNKTALVTGAASGNGKAIATLFAPKRCKGSSCRLKQRVRDTSCRRFAATGL